MSGVIKIRNFSTPSVRPTTAATATTSAAVHGHEKSVLDSQVGIEDVRHRTKAERESMAWQEGLRGSDSDDDADADGDDDDDDDTDSCADEDGLTSNETSSSSNSSVSSSEKTPDDTSVAFIVDNEIAFVPSIIRLSGTPFDLKGLHQGPFIARGSGNHQDPYTLSIPLPVFRIFLWCLFPKTVPTRVPVSRQAWVWVMILAEKWKFTDLETRARAELGLQKSCI